MLPSAHTLYCVIARNTRQRSSPLVMQLMRNSHDAAHWAGSKKSIHLRNDLKRKGDKPRLQKL